MQSPILHHFEASPFSEKVRIVFGFKRMAWRSVLIPRIMPKPDLIQLTGGYRRTPVMQIGADIFCDTQIILRELEARYPQPSICPGHGSLSYMTVPWTDRVFFNSTVYLVFGSRGSDVPQSFIDDRTKLRGAPFDVAQMAATVPHHRDQFRAHAFLIEEQLAHGQPWLLGDFSLADVNAYMNIWYVRSNLPVLADELLAAFPRLRDWEQRVQALGHGTRQDISAEDALRVAAESQPMAAAPEAADPDGRAVGDRVRVVADEPVRTAVEGEIVSMSPKHIAIKRRGDKVGDVVVHFPRIGYCVETV